MVVVWHLAKVSAVKGLLRCRT